MTNAIEQTKREMYGQLSAMKFYGSTYIAGFESALELHLEALRQDRAKIIEERDALRNRTQVLEMANSTSGDMIRSLRKDMEASYKAQRLLIQPEPKELPENASGAIMVILSAIEEAQKVMVEWLVPGGIRAKKAMSKIVPALDNEPLFLAIRKLEECKPAACQHSFHPFPMSRHEKSEACIFCGISK